MMELDEGNRLLDSTLHNDDNSMQPASARQSVSEVMDNCINNPREGKPLKMALTLALGNAADAVEIMCIGFIISDIDDVSTLNKQFLTAAVFLGMFFGGLLGGALSDSFGRQRSLVYSLGINALAGVLSAFSPSIEVLVLFRVFAGLGIGASVPMVFSLGAELFPAQERGFFLSIIASFWMVGAIFSAFTAWILLGDDFHGDKILPRVHWRWFALVSSLPPILAFVLTYYTLPESPRYLLLSGRTREAAEVLNEISTVRVAEEDLISLSAPLHNNSYHADIINPLSPDGSETKDITSIEIGGERSASNNSAPKAESNGRFLDAVALLFSERHRTTTLVLMAIWFLLSFGSYGISTWISVLFSDVGISNAYAASFIYSLANLPGNLISIFFIDVYGRRWLLSVGMCLAGLFSIGFAIDTKHSVTVVLFASLFNAFSIVGWNSLDCLSAEGFPTVARSTAMGILAASGRLGAVAGQFVNGSLESNIPLLLFVTSACSILGGVIAWALPRDTVGSLERETDSPAPVT